MNYEEINKHSWNNRVDVHMNSEFYDMDAFKEGKSSLNDIELELLGDVKDLKILHLQCHFGQDTISLSRMGAQMTGVDLSDKSIEKARELSAELEQDIRFINCNVVNLKEHCDDKFDLIFTSYGTIIWLPDLDEWAEIVSSFLKPGGKFIIVDFHPVVWMFDDDFTRIQYNYFNTGPINEFESGTYADQQADISQQIVCWNHSTSETLNALISKGLIISAFHEYDYSPYNCLSHMKKYDDRVYRIEKFDNKIPLVFAITAEKPL